jgi:hypothetical protein
MALTDLVGTELEGDLLVADPTDADAVGAPASASEPSSKPASSKPGHAPRRRGRKRRSGWAYLLLALMFAGAVAWFVIELTRPDYRNRPTGDGAVQAATAQTMALMSLDYRTAKADLQRVVDGSTGTMHDEYAKALPASVATTSSQKSVSTGSIKSVGLSSFSGNKAEVLVAGDATVAFPKVGAQAASKIAVRYRFRVEMQYVNGVWKSAELDFAGLPPFSQVG